MLLSVVLVWGLLRTLAAGTPLDDYVNAPDPHYEYRDLGKPFRGADYTTHFLNMTSQKWLNGKCPDCTLRAPCSVLLVTQANVCALHCCRVRLLSLRVVALLGRDRSRQDPAP